MRAVAITIGNSDDKLTQKEWSDFFHEVRGLIRHQAQHVHGEFASLPNAPYQNACFLVEIELTDGLLQQLADIAGDYRQESIALTMGETTFVSGAAARG